LAALEVDRRRRFGGSRRLAIVIAWIGSRWRWRQSGLLEERCSVRDVFLIVRDRSEWLRRCEMVRAIQAAIEDELGFVMIVWRFVVLLLRGCVDMC
jgi:hypothetical protein